MPRRLPRQRPGARLRNGTSLLTRSAVIDSTPIAARLQPFATLHHQYTTAQSAVVAARAAVAEHHALLVTRDADQNQAIDTLARALVLDRYRTARLRPLAAYSNRPPSLLKRMAAGAKARAIQKLVLAIERDTSLSAQSHAAAAALARAAADVDAARRTVAHFEDVLRREIIHRDALGDQWDAAYAAVKRRARYAAIDDAPELYAFLFGKPRRRRHRLRTKGASLPRKER